MINETVAGRLKLGLKTETETETKTGRVRVRLFYRIGRRIGATLAGGRGNYSSVYEQTGRQAGRQAGRNKYDMWRVVVIRCRIGGSIGGAEKPNPSVNLIDAKVKANVRARGPEGVSL